MFDDCYREFEVFLDIAQENKIFVKFFLNPNGVDLEDFVIIYFTKVGEEFMEVVKYDFSQKESLHVHYFYPKNPRKVFLELAPALVTIVVLYDELVSSWHKHLLRFNDKD